MAKRVRAEDPVQRFFAFARERHAVHLRRAAGDPPPWTADPILRSYRFCNVYRELDKTTRWFKKNVRDPLRSSADLIPATVLFRWFNRIDSGEVLFCQPGLFGGRTAFEEYMALSHAGRPEDTRSLRVAMRRKGPPFVTGSYTINTRGVGRDKLDGVLRLYTNWLKTRDWVYIKDVKRAGGFSLQSFCEWAQGDGASHFGPFMAYEVACDLRHTDLLRDAPDVLTWANVGPGARRGLWRLRGVEDKAAVEQPMPDEEALVMMHFLLKCSCDPRYWPQPSIFNSVVSPVPLGLIGDGMWPAWELREVEHTLCEFDKYERVCLGQGRPRGRFHP